MEIAVESTSMAVTCPAPKCFAAGARIPLPVPRSTSDQPRFHRRLSSSKNRSDIAVVACSPVPKANEAGITRSGGLKSYAAGLVILGACGLERRRGIHRGLRALLPCNASMEVATTNRFPIRIGFSLRTVNRSSQSTGNCSMRPPNSLTTARAVLRDWQTISSCRRLRPGLCTITRSP